MAKHTVLVAITVDDKYTAKDVKLELGIACTSMSSELFDTCTGMHTAVPKVYVVWNAYKAGGSDTYEELLAHEAEVKGSVSSEITTDDIDVILNAVTYECDIELHCHLLGDA